MSDYVRCSKCKAPFERPMQHTGVCDQPGCNGLGERYAPPIMSTIIVEISPDFVPEDGTAFDAVVAALEHFEIPAYVEQRDASETIIEGAREVDARMREILKGDPANA
jgi:hypothetical protein